MNAILNAQHNHWENKFTQIEEMFGKAPSEPAQKTVKLLKEEGKEKLLELGGGQGRDTIFFSSEGLHVNVLDYAQPAIETISQKAKLLGLSALIHAQKHDVREPLPFENESFDACFSHMLYCMPLTTIELEYLTREIARVLRPGGLNIYTVRHTGDPHFGQGISRGEDMYEVGGFIVHFFSEAKVRHLSEGFELVKIEEFEEGTLPRKLFRVILRKR